MTDPDDRTRKLDWIRDGMKWVVGISGGLLALSATYFYDRFEQAPRFSSALWLAWMLLIVASLAGILAALSTWKNVGQAGAFGPFLRGCYFVAMWSFTIAFPLLAGVLVANVATPRKPHGTADLFLVAERFPAFEPASATPSDPRFIAAACMARRALDDSGSRSALVVGRFDQRELSSRAQSRVMTNVELAQRRADRVGAILTDATLCNGRPLRSVVTLTSGPRIGVGPNAARVDVNALLADDRRVDVYGFRPPPP